MKKNKVLSNSKIKLDKVVRLYFVCLLTIITLLVIKFLGPLNINAAFYIFLILILLVVLGLNFHNNKTVIVAYMLMSVVLIIYHHTTDPLQTSDAFRYYQQIFNYNSYIDYLNFFIQDIKINLLDASSYTVFSFFYIPFYQMFKVPSPYFIVFLNVPFLIAALYLSRKLFFGNYSSVQIQHKSIVLNYFIILTFSSASLLYFSSTFYKDILSLLLCLMTVYLFLKKRYLLFAVVLFISLALRPYAIVTSLIYFVFIKDMQRSAMLGVILSAAYVFYESGVVGFINSFLNIRYLLFSPNPFSLENYLELPLQTVESLLLIIFFLLSIIVFIYTKDSRRIFIMGIMCIYIYSCVMTLVGYDVIEGRSMDYVIGTAGDSFSRKKMGIIILIYFIFANVLSILKNQSSRKI